MKYFLIDISDLSSNEYAVSNGPFLPALPEEMQHTCQSRLGFDSSCV